jgi:hypothetical protein
LVARRPQRPPSHKPGSCALQSRGSSPCILAEAYFEDISSSRCQTPRLLPTLCPSSASRDRPDSVQPCQTPRAPTTDSLARPAPVVHGMLRRRQEEQVFCWQFEDNNIHDDDGWEPCGRPRKDQVAPCCKTNNVCLEGGICRSGNTTGGASGYYQGSCTQEAYEDNLCPHLCSTSHRFQSL